MGVASQEILGEIFFKDVADARNLLIGSSEFKRNLNGYFGVARAQEILEEICIKEWPGARN